MAVLDDVLRLLQDNAVGTIATDLFADFMPDSPDALIAAFSVGGSPPDFAGGPTGAPAIRNPTVTLWARAAERDPVAAQAKAEAAYQAMVGVVNQILQPSAERYLRIEPLQEPFLLKLDEQERPIVACNYEVMKQ